MCYWPLDTPYRPATVKEALRLILSQLAPVKVRVDILIVLSRPHLSVKNLYFPYEIRRWGKRFEKDAQETAALASVQSLTPLFIQQAYLSSL